MTTTTMDLGRAPARADRRAPAPTSPYQTTQSGQAAVMSFADQTDRGRPPPDVMRRFVLRTMWALFTVALIHSVGLDVLAMLARWALGFLVG